MSELILRSDNCATIRWKLLAGASALALTAYVFNTSLAKAEDSDRPQIWIELGGQLNRLQDGQELFTPPFLGLTPSNLSPPQNAERPPLFGWDENSALTFQPEGSKWIFSAAIRYGRAGSGKHVHHQSSPAPIQVYQINRKHVRLYHSVLPSVARFSDAVVKQDEENAILDFQVGKDVGLGILGDEGVSSLNLGVRIAQFQSKSRVSLREDPDWRFETGIVSFFGNVIQYALQPYHSFAGTFRADRSFSGIGPSLSWKSSMPFAGNAQDGALTLDWGVNASMLFGRQNTRTKHETSGAYHTPGHGPIPQPVGNPPAVPIYDHAPPPQTRSRGVAIPNVGAFAGLSYVYANAKLSFGYKADFFFGAIDGGIDIAKNENRAFYGPYASISIGLGSSDN